MAGDKATQAEIRKRVNLIYKAIIRGASRTDILQLASKSGWNVTDRTVDSYIKKARDSFREKSDVVRDEQFVLALERLEYLFQSNLQIQDYKAALQVQKELNTILDLYPAKRTEVTGADGGAMEFKLVYPED